MEEKVFGGERLKQCRTLEGLLLIKLRRSAFPAQRQRNTRKQVSHHQPPGRSKCRPSRLDFNTMKPGMKNRLLARMLILIENANG
jgi:hypothetical protein